jgi:hypothetical protein
MVVVVEMGKTGGCEIWEKFSLVRFAPSTPPYDGALDY